MKNKIITILFSISIFLIIAYLGYDSQRANGTVIDTKNNNLSASAGGISKCKIAECSGYCYACEAGYYGENYIKGLKDNEDGTTYYCTGYSKCTKCKAGYYCPEGTYSARGASVCTHCQAGTYSSAGSASCTRCPSGYTSAQRATAQNACYISVSAGKYLATANGTTQTACGELKYNLAHKVYYGSTSSCQACSSTCKTCDSKTGRCLTCESGYYVSNRECVQCPEACMKQG